MCRSTVSSLATVNTLTAPCAAARLRDELLGEPTRGQLGAEGGQQARFQDAAILSERALVFLGLYWR